MRFFFLLVNLVIVWNMVIFLINCCSDLVWIEKVELLVDFFSLVFLVFLS